MLNIAYRGNSLQLPQNLPQATNNLPAAKSNLQEIFIKTARKPASCNKRQVYTNAELSVSECDTERSRKVGVENLVRNAFSGVAITSHISLYLNLNASYFVS
jgi:hypothetical protein